MQTLWLGSLGPWEAHLQADVARQPAALSAFIRGAQLEALADENKNLRAEKALMELAASDESGIELIKMSK